MGTRFDVTIRAYHTHFPFKEQITTATSRSIFLNTDLTPANAKHVATEVIKTTEIDLYMKGIEQCSNQYQENSIRVHRAKKGRVKSLATIKKISCEDGEKDNGNM